MTTLLDIHRSHDEARPGYPACSVTVKEVPGVTSPGFVISRRGEYSLVLSLHEATVLYETLRKRLGGEPCTACETRKAHDARTVESLKDHAGLLGIANMDMGDVANRIGGVYEMADYVRAVACISDESEVEELNEKRGLA